MKVRKNKTISLILLSLIMVFPGIFYQDKLCFFKDNDLNNNKNLKISQADILIDSYLVPSVSESISSSQLIKIGLLNDFNYLYGVHAWNGALLAAREVNENGGIIINGTKYYVGLVKEDTHEVFGTASQAIEAAENIINDHHPHFITGGFMDSLYDYLEIVMDYKIPFLGTGHGGAPLCEHVQENYARYKYFFRISPLNLTFFMFEYASYIGYLCLYYLNTIDAGIVNKTAILRDETGFFEIYSSKYKNEFFPPFGISVLNDTILPYSATETDFNNFWNQIQSDGVQVVFSMSAGIPNYEKLLAQTYQQIRPKCLIVKFSPFGQLNSDWDDVEGNLQFMIDLQAIYNVSKTNLTIPFFTRYVSEYYGIEPFFTGASSYDAVKLLVQTVNETQTFNSDVTVSALERINMTNYYIGAWSNIAFTATHDLRCLWPFGYSLFCQWKNIDGTKVVVTHNNTFTPIHRGYPDSLSTGSLRLPYWGINGLLTDPPQPPGSFTMDSTAETPDTDGKFNLTWTDSEGAKNYSIYMSNNPFTYISKKFQVLAYQTASKPFQMALKKGEYYFRIVAYNETGETMSNLEHVSIAGPGPFSLTSSAETPYDTDGNFDLIWTKSERADNYSVYRHTSKITAINESLTLLANQTVLSKYSISGLDSGQYYFAVVAHNKLGSTISSNNEDVTVQLPFDWSVIIIISISSVAGVASIFLIRKYWRHRVKLVSKAEGEKPLHKGKSGEKKIPK